MEWHYGVTAKMNGYRAEASNQVSAVMNASAATGGTSHGNFIWCLVAIVIRRMGCHGIITDPYRLKKQGMIEVTNFIMVDIKPRAMLKLSAKPVNH